MTSTNNPVEPNGNGEKAVLNGAKHTLWTPKASDNSTPEPLWYLRVSVLKNQESRGDCPSRRFTFKSVHHLTHAQNQLEAAFGTIFDLRRCGVETPDAMGGRVNDGRCENITVEFDGDAAGAMAWKDFLAQLKGLEDEWDHEGVSLL